MIEYKQEVMGKDNGCRVVTDDHTSMLKESCVDRPTLPLFQVKIRPFFKVIVAFKVSSYNIKTFHIK